MKARRAEEDGVEEDEAVFAVNTDWENVRTVAQQGVNLILDCFGLLVEHRLARLLDNAPSIFRRKA